MQKNCSTKTLAVNADILHISGMSHCTPVEKAIAAAGGEAEFLDRLSISRRTLFYWKADGIPPVRLAAVIRATGLTASDLRPDLFPAPASAA